MAQSEDNLRWESDSIYLENAVEGVILHIGEAYTIPSGKKIMPLGYIPFTGHTSLTARFLRNQRVFYVPPVSDWLMGYFTSRY
jgi:hypothetical protein